MNLAWTSPTLHALLGVLAVVLFVLPKLWTRIRRKPAGRELSMKARRVLELSAVAAALIGLALMAQPLWSGLFRVGFFTLLGGGLAYVSTTFWPPSGLTAWGAARLLYWVFYTLAVVLWLSAAAAPALLRL